MVKHTHAHARTHTHFCLNFSKTHVLCILCVCVRTRWCIYAFFWLQGISFNDIIIIINRWSTQTWNETVQSHLKNNNQNTSLNLSLLYHNENQSEYKNAIKIYIQKIYTHKYKYTTSTKTTSAENTPLQRETLPRTIKKIFKIKSRFIGDDD